MTKYSFCESVTSEGMSPWHIRRLTSKGQNTVGGVDTDPLCRRLPGMFVKDLLHDVNTDGDHHLCRECVMFYAALPVDEES